MKVFMVLNSQLDARITCDLLRANGVEAMFRGSREYASVVTGMDYGRYEVLVPEDCLEEAESIMNDSSRVINSQKLPFEIVGEEKEYKEYKDEKPNSRKGLRTKKNIFLLGLFIFYLISMLIWWVRNQG